MEQFQKTISRANKAQKTTLLSSTLFLLAASVSLILSIKFPEIPYLTTTGYILGGLGILSVITSLIIGTTALDYASKFVKENKEE